MKEKDLNYWKENAKDAYMITPICVLKYISELEKVVKNNDLLPDPNWEIIQTAPHGTQYKHKETGEIKWE